MDILLILAIHHPFSHLFKITKIWFEDSSFLHSLVMWSGWGSNPHLGRKQAMQSGQRPISASHFPSLEVSLSLRVTLRTWPGMLAQGLSFFGAVIEPGRMGSWEQLQITL